MTDHLTPREVADMLKVSRRTVTEYARNGTLPVIRISHRKVLFRRSDVEALLTPKTEGSETK